jgi:hypothetical protein
MSARKVPRIERKAQHPHAPTENWKALQQGVADAATRSADQRAARDRERTDSTDYARNQRAQTEGT